MAKHRGAHSKSGSGRYTPPKKTLSNKKLGLLVGGGVLAGAGFLGLTAAPSFAASATAFPFGTSNHFSLFGNTRTRAHSSGLRMQTPATASS